MNSLFVNSLFGVPALAGQGSPRRLKPGLPTRIMRSWLAVGLGALGSWLPALAQSEGPAELRLEIRLETGVAAVVLHNTTIASRYHILSKTSLAQEQWRVEC